MKPLLKGTVVGVQAATTNAISQEICRRCGRHPRIQDDPGARPRLGGWARRCVVRAEHGAGDDAAQARISDLHACRPGIRGGLQSVPYGQIEAARACGMVELVGLPSHSPADRAAPRLARLRQRDHSHDAIRSPPPWRSKLSRSTRNAIFSDMSLRSRRASKGGSGNWASKSWSARPAARAWSAPRSWSRTRRRERISIPRSAPPRMWASARRRTA